MKAADKARPTDEQLRKVDEAAPPDQFENSPNQNTVGGENAGLSKDPNTGVQQAGVAGLTVTHDPTTGNVQVGNRDGTQQSAAGAGNDAAGLAQAHVQETQAAMAQDTNPDGTKKSLKDRMKAGIDSIGGRIPDEHKQRAQDQVQQAKDFMNEEFPQERRDQYIYRLKKVCISRNVAIIM